MKMMWLTTSLILISVTGFLCNEYQEGHEKLNDRSTLGILKLCRDLEARCDRNLFNYIRDAVEYLKENKPTLEVLSRSIECVKRVSKMDSPLGVHMSPANRERVENSIKSYTEDLESDMFNCIKQEISAMCAIIPYGHYCGEDVQEAILEVVSNAGLCADCSPEELETLRPFFELSKGVIREELSLRGDEKKRK